MTDAFLCDVIKNNGDGTWDVRPRIVEFDGTNHKIIKVCADGGIYPMPSDLVLVVTARNNLDNKKINRFYEASESNGRVVAIAKPILFYTFKGDFKFEGTVFFNGSMTIQEDLIVNGNLVVAKNATVGQNLIVTQDISAGGDMSAGGNIMGSGDLTILGEASVGTLTVGGSDYALHTHLNNATSYPASAPTGPVI